MTEQLMETYRKMIQEYDERKNNNPWMDNLIRNDKGKIENCIDNYILYFNESTKYAGKLKYNEYLRQFEYDGKPWDELKEATAINDIERDIGLTGVQKAKNAIQEIFGQNSYNPVLVYINNLKWDGEERMERLFIDLLEAEDTELNRMMTRKWFMAAIKRAIQPGCKFDNILILKGAQGVGKSTICERLAKGFYSTVSLDEISNKDVIDKMNKSWICIIDELDTFSKKEMTTVKTFLSTSIDTTRLAYGRYSKQYKRHCIFIGSTNEDTFLRDSTSNVERRFWIIDCKREKYDPIVNITMTDEYVDQLWAEAYHKLMEDPDQYLDIEADYIEEFAERQKDSKKFRNDPVISYVKDILEKEYVLNKGKFNDDMDFYNQFVNNNVYDNNLMKSKLERVTMSSLLYVLKRAFGETRAVNYIINALESDGLWRRGTVRKSSGSAPETGIIRNCKPIS